MAKEKLTKRGYVCDPGTYMPLPEIDGKQYRDVKNPNALNSQFVRFEESTGLYFTYDPVVQQHIEESRQFRNGRIRRFDTPEERRQKEAQAKVDQFIANEKQRIEIMGVANAGLPDEKASDAQIRKYAELVGVATADEEGAKLTKIRILEGIYAALGIKTSKSNKEENEQ
jgi:hypothetical protein